MWDLPVIFIVENNGYGLSTTTKEQYRCANIADKGVGYGMKSIIIDGNNILELIIPSTNWPWKCAKSYPAPVECKTFRMRGHEEASGVKYVPKELLETWALKDPLENYERFLLEEGILDEKAIAKHRKDIKDEIEAAWEITVSEPEIEPNTEEELRDVYAPFSVGSSTVGSGQSRPRPRKQSVVILTQYQMGCA